MEGICRGVKKENTDTITHPFKESTVREDILAIFQETSPSGWKILLNKDLLTSTTIIQTPFPPNLAVCVLGSCPSGSPDPLVAPLKLRTPESL